MATYKVIQDVEAEDKFVGPLTLKQFIFACAGVLFGYLNIFAISRGAPVLMGIFLPPMALAFFLAVPWSRDQPTELWVLGRLRFLLKPKKRLWDQSGIQELVTITAPKKEEKNLTKDYSEGEVKSRLKALAETIDSRGWAVKHASLEEGRPRTSEEMVSDRLVDASSMMPKQVPEFDVEAVPDVLDPSSSPISGNINNMIQTRGNKRKDEMLKKMEKARRGEPIDTSAQQSQSNISINQSQPPSQPTTNNIDEQMLNKQLQAKKQEEQSARSHMRGIPNKGTKNEEQKTTKPADSQATSNTTASSNPTNKNQPATQSQQPSTQSSGSTTQASAPMTSGDSTDTIRLASNNDLNIATLAREAERKGESGEVVVSLH